MKKEVQTVTSLLKYKNKILLLKRSQRVGFYAGKWAGVSGFLEEGEIPEERAKIEIFEETGLKGKILKKGKVIKVFDKELNANVVIHLFLFEVKKQKVKLNWEHDDYVWIKPEEINKYDTVPILNRIFKILLKN
ncbi:MAG: NUDIX domain-containing protein [Candidatus Parvarchaeota archaeon]|nr:NUDIX domain-containing protein [Candidatus Jingweiarchaeum tengchongense]MCW1298141.1 NUDIX domain-containing protein [Candidatus Jingweiarchaeum tengchongense]MCW1299940.1 NUDIX domain-containing protein [Candidatus Jingweiarchaeum tengchongense]MCW1305075.1 NUDIX domain-containing protein [Candidatus Jingweiarchaeum tengchongense]MCW1305562.1 NUDIX domain-containing protein [Candidatus Jingweiarchaeum tengchongense]